MTTGGSSCQRRDTEAASFRRRRCSGSRQPGSQRVMNGHSRVTFAPNSPRPDASGVIVHAVVDDSAVRDGRLACCVADRRHTVEKDAKSS